MVFAAICAGGRGTRMGSALPKQFLRTADGLPIIVRTVGAFAYSGQVDRIAVAVPEDRREYTCELIASNFPARVYRNVSVISGGGTRMQTLALLAEHFIATAPKDETNVILTHDAVRPNIDDIMIARNVAAASSCGAATTVIPAVDTMISSSDGVFQDGVYDRGKMYNVQTPQTFILEELYGLLTSTPPEELERFTDAASLFVSAGKKVRLVPGSRSNIKITYKEDLAAAP